MRYVPYQTPINGTLYQSYPPTIGNIGGYGYAQNGYYNQYFNPYYLRQQQEAQKRLEIQETKNQMQIWSQLINCYNSAYGYEKVDENVLMQQMQDRARLHYQCSADEENADHIRRIVQEAQQLQQQLQQQEQNTPPPQPQQEDDTTLYQWLHGAGQERYDEFMRAEVQRYQRNTSNLYDSNSYNQLLSSHESVFNSLNRNVNIDDMEIQVNLPQKLKDERDIRRMKFIESLRRNM